MNTNKNMKQLLLGATIAALLVSVSSFAADGDKSKIKGMITGVQGNTITVKDANNAEKTFTVSPTTKIQSISGLVGAQQKKVEQTALIPGLPVTADVVAAGAGFDATEVEFKASDFKTAQQVQAGLAPTKQRMNDFGTYEALATVDVLFASGSSTISEQGKKDLLALAAKSKETKDYRVVMQGFTDSVGNAAANQKLSAMRARAVGNFLQQKGGLSPGRVTEPDAMGVAADAGTGSNANARKVTVKLVVDKGVQAGKQ
jgi:outer membrane protein OmpA-like peptidoglycan-associated protein